MKEMYWADNAPLAELFSKADEMKAILDTLGPVKGVMKAKDKLCEC